MSKERLRFSALSLGAGDMKSAELAFGQAHIQSYFIPHVKSGFRSNRKWPSEIDGKKASAKKGARKKVEGELTKANGNLKKVDGKLEKVNGKLKKSVVYCERWRYR